MTPNHGAALSRVGLANPQMESSAGARRQPNTRWHLAWLLLTLALAGHVLDEALNDFLSVYNPAVETVRQTLPWLPLPTFTFEAWIGGLVVAILLLAALAPLVHGGSRWMRVLSHVYGGIMALNGMGHLGGSLLLGRWLPGVVSSPFLLAAALFLLASVVRPEVREPGRLPTVRES